MLDLTLISLARAKFVTKDTGFGYRASARGRFRHCLADWGL